MRYFLLLSMLAIFSVVSTEKLEVTAKVILDVIIEWDKKGGKIEIELYGKTVPKTVKNFIELCKKPEGEGYKGCEFYRIFRNDKIIAGDFTKGDGTGGHSIYGRYFDSENFEVELEEAGTVAMGNVGGDTNSSIFFILVEKTKQYSGRYVAFGKVVKGMDYVKKISRLKTSYYKTPFKKVVITDCTVIEESNDTE